MKKNVSLTINNGDSAQGEVSIQEFDQKGRTKRALKVLGIGWLCAGVVVLIPLLHFILVPSFFFGSIYFAWVTNGQKAVVLGGEGTCPACHKPFPLMRSPWKWPLKVTCPNCLQTVTIEPSP